MNRYLMPTAICLAALFATNTFAGQYTQLRRSHEAQKAEFTHAYHAQRRQLRQAYRHSQDMLVAERRALSRIDCHETRSRRLRVNSRELGALARENSRQNRALSSAYHDGLRALRQDYELARKRIRSGHPHVVMRSHAHSANCDCEACARPTVIQRYHDHDDFDGRYRDRHARQHRKPNGVDIAVAILSMLQ